MSQLYRERSHSYWNNHHKSYDRATIVYDDWLVEFDDLIMSAKNPILDLGCGSGNDTLYLVEKGKRVISCDQSENAIQNIRKNFPEITDAKCFNMLDGLPFEDASFEVIIADLCLHYFTKKDTDFILFEIRRILIPGGHLIFRVNSVNDVNHGAGKGPEIEPHVFETESKELKRFFDEADIRSFCKDVEIKFRKEAVMTRYEKPKPLFRVCVKK